MILIFPTSINSCSFQLNPLASRKSFSGSSSNETMTPGSSNFSAPAQMKPSPSVVLPEPGGPSTIILLLRNTPPRNISSSPAIPICTKFELLNFFSSSLYEIWQHAPHPARKSIAAGGRGGGAGRARRGGEGRAGGV